jgi:hypothetical protein
MSVRAVVALTLALLVAGCATVPQNTLTQDKRDALRIDAIELSFAPDALILWMDAYSGAPEEPAAKRAYLEQKAAGPIKAALDAEIKQAFRGTDPAKLRVRIRFIHIQATALRIIVGAAPFAIRADLDLVDAKSGQTLLAATDFDGLTMTFGGLAGAVESAVSEEPIIRVSKSFAVVLSRWLKTGISNKFG